MHAFSNSFLAISCTSEENLVTEKDSLLFENFKSNFPQFSKSISQNHIQGVLIENQLNKSANNLLMVIHFRLWKKIM